MSTIGVIVENERFQEIVDILERIEENTRPKLKPKSESVDINIDHLRDLFFARLNEKTGWGRNELKQVFDECVMEGGLW
jgi:hypothetical protein